MVHFFFKSKSLKPTEKGVRSYLKRIYLCGLPTILKRRIQVYEAQVVSVLLYGSCSWAAPKHVFERLKTTHRSILNITWPNIISNENLYKRCDVTPITERVDISRWTMLGHVLRLPENSPAALALVFAIDGCSAKSRRGRHQVNLFNTIKSDLVLRGFSLSNIDDLYVLRDVARDRKKWRSLYDVLSCPCTDPTWTLLTLSYSMFVNS